MKSTAFICGLAACAVAGELWAKEYPLTLTPLTVEEAAALPAGAGVYAQLQLTKPAELKREPPGAAGQSLYGVIGRAQGNSGMIFRLDGTTGEKGGHDRLLLDLNQNGDLTDEAPIKVTGTPKIARSGSYTTETAWFGPIQAPAARRIAPGTPTYFAQLYYYNFGVASGTSTARSQPYLGMLRLRPGCWLETTAELAGQNRKIGILDGNANFRLGEESRPVFSGTGKTATWYFPPADSFLVDRNGSGKFEADRADSEVSPFGPMLAFGNTAFRVKLTANCAALDIQPWPGAAANLTVQSQGAQVRDVTLGWERGTKDWVLLKAGLNQGWAAVPPGVLVFNGCVLEAQTRAGLPLMLVGTYRKLDKTVRATAGQTATLACGGPLEVQLTATKRKASDATDVGSAVRSGRAVAETFVDIEAEIVGRAGESYGTFLTGKNLTSTPTPPQFTITTRDGKKVASGTMEYG